MGLCGRGGEQRSHLLSALDELDCDELSRFSILHELGDTEVTAADVADLRRESGSVGAHPLGIADVDRPGGALGPGLWPLSAQ